MKTMFSCYVFGDGSLTIRCAEILQNEGHDLRGIVTSNPEVAAWAKARAVALIDPASNLLATLGERPFDYLLSIANMRVLPKEIVTLPKQGAINFHDGPLPRYAGVHATSWALMKGERTHGITWHTMGERVDTGEILAQATIDVAEDETAFSLNTKCFEAGSSTFAQLVRELSEGTTAPRAQDLTKRSYFGAFKRPPAAGVISWERPAGEIVALVRALEFGLAPNPLGRAKVALGREFFLCPDAAPGDAPAGSAPGTILAIAASHLSIAAAEGAVVIRRLLTLDGQLVSLPETTARLQLQVGALLTGWDQAAAERTTALNTEFCRQESYWVARLASLQPASLPYFSAGGAAPDQTGRASIDMDVPETVTALLAGQRSSWQPGEFLLAAFAVYVKRVSGESEFDLGISLPPWNAELAGQAGLFAGSVPVRFTIDYTQSFDETLLNIRTRLGEVRERKTFLRDVTARYPELRAAAAQGLRNLLPVHVRLTEALGTPGQPDEGSGDGALVLTVPARGERCRWTFDTAVLKESNVRLMIGQFSTFLAGIAADTTAQVGLLPILTQEETRDLVSGLNATEVAIVSDVSNHGSFERQVGITPDAIAVVCRDEEITYRELNARANQLARHLRKLGVGPDTLVAISLERSIALAVGLLGILKAGGAYVPLDPSYPAERISFMLEDSKAPVVLTQQSFVARLPEHHAKVVQIDADWAQIAREETENVESGVQPHHLAYVIYTSGSTGKPKGVMIEHRNVVNFFIGMDQRIGSEPGVWLAVTSISFDISVLELFWTLARRFKVVMVTDEDRLALAPARSRRRTAKNIDFSLFYFASEIGGDPKTRYRLLIEGAKFGDQHGFAAVWTPERHFHSFGGLYSNPSIVSAALATLTSRISIRAGSVVSPLHNPVRLAEEWSLVDNLSGGRVGVSFAAGWQANDFVFAPERFADRKRIMYEDIEIVRRLWRGEAVARRNGEGRDAEVRIFPTPIQPELPIWVTAAGNPETFRQAGEIGANILTHLLGQKFEDVEAKIRIYREARAKAGHPGRGHATLMLHTFVGETMEAVKETVRGPMCRYLETSIDLIRSAPFAFPTFKVPSDAVAEKVKQGLNSFSPDEMNVLLEFAFERYFDTSGLFGTVERCLEITERCKECDVDEIGCLIDYGVPVEQALNGLHLLNEVRDRATRPVSAGREKDYSILAQIETHGVTHLQCTPSLARMIADQPGGMEALAGLQRLMLGGEALPQDLLARLRRTVRGEVHNMYGPTETTIWSTTDLLPPAEDFITIGKPIANTQVYVVDRRLRLLPIGLPGELLIGGDGVARGYLNRDDLTREKFIPDPFHAKPGGRLYRTGDLVAWRPDGRLDFLGRLDHQVKIRGHRIELGEIEVALTRHPQVSAAVVVARIRSSGEAELAAFYTSADGKGIDVAELRALLAQNLPDYMIPAAFVRLDRLPTTPNGKIDRKALATMPVTVEQAAPVEASAEPKSELEQQVAAVFAEALEVNTLGIDANFFELGANSLTMVRVASKLGEVFPGRMGLMDLFQHTTIRSLAKFLANGDSAAAEKPQAQRGSDRGRRRRESLLRRQG